MKGNTVKVGDKVKHKEFEVVEVTHFKADGHMVYCSDGKWIAIHDFWTGDAVIVESN